MPTISQLPIAPVVNPSDEVLLSQSGVTRSAAVATLLSTTQAAITLATGSVLGRTSLGAGGPEPLTLGPGLNASAGALSATGSDHTGFPVQPAPATGDEVIINSGGLPHRMLVSQLRNLFSAGTNIAIDPTGIISASPANIATSAVGPAGPTGPTGPVGATGPAGQVGQTGTAGAAGPIGPIGLAGPQGPVGQQGVQGNTGPAGAVGATGATGPAGTAGAQGAQGAVGPAWNPPKRMVTAATDVPSLADDQGVIAYNTAQAVTVTVNDLGSLRAYDTIQLGSGIVTLVPGSGVTMMSQGKSVTSLLSAYQGAALSVVCTGSGTVFVIGNSQ